MKIFIAILSLLLPFLLAAQVPATDHAGHTVSGITRFAKDSISMALMAANPDSSAVGGPIGEKSKGTIGAEGGKLVSADGMMELILPPGALTAPTEIGIQSVENTLLTGFGNAYACTPDGIQFLKPVQMTIHYTYGAAKGMSPLIPTIRWQDKAGKWTNVKAARMDTAARMLHCRIEHFSTYVGATTFTLLYPYPPVKLNTLSVFRLEITGTYPDGKAYTKETAERDYWSTHFVKWFVNDIPNGNNTWGKINTSGILNGSVCVYTAPATLPPSNPRITAKFMDRVPVGDGYADGVAVSRSIVIYDEFHYSFTGYDRAGHLHMIDSATCDIQAHSSGAVKLTNIKNPTPWCDWLKSSGGCSYDYPDKTGWKGMVELGKMQNAECDPPSEEGKPLLVSITLGTQMGSSPRYVAHCHKKTLNVASMPVTAQPYLIQFEATADGNILVQYGNASGKGEINYVPDGQGFVIRITRKVDPPPSEN